MVTGIPPPFVLWNIFSNSRMFSASMWKYLLSMPRVWVLQSISRQARSRKLLVFLCCLQNKVRNNNVGSAHWSQSAIHCQAFSMTPMTSPPQLPDPVGWSRQSSLCWPAWRGWPSWWWSRCSFASSSVRLGGSAMARLLMEKYTPLTPRHHLSQQGNS